MFTVVLTHDVDFWQVRDMPFLGRGHLSFMKRSILDNLGRVGKDLTPSTYAGGVLSALGTLLRFKPDPWAANFLRMIEIERRWGVRSTIFVIPFRGDPGVDSDGNPAQRGRAALYDIAVLAPLLRELQDHGWEIGVHGLRGHVSAADARREREALESLGLAVRGWRSHWLITSPMLYSNLIQVGYCYDSSIREGQWQGPVSFVQDGGRLAVLPITIQDKDVLEGRQIEDGWVEIKRRLDKAANTGGTATILFHTNHFGPPRFWGVLFERILEYAAERGAVVGPAIGAVREQVTVT